MPSTFRVHFNQDIARAEAMLAKSDAMLANGEPSLLCADTRCSSVALAVGALDAYLCDAFVDCLASVLQSYVAGNWIGALPSAYANQMLPAGEVLSTTRPNRPNWSIRMSARSIMEKDNMLSLSKLEDCFNGILPPNQKLWAHFYPRLLAYNRKRLTLHDAAGFAAVLPKDRTKEEKKVIYAVKRRLGRIIQFRHDWIHNCGRPKNAILEMTSGQARANIRDVKTFVTELDDHLALHRLA